MARIIIVSNRLPITIDRKEGELVYYPSAGGLATGLSSLDRSVERVWIGWPGRTVESPEEQQQIAGRFREDGMIPVFLSDEDMSLYYEGFSNKTIWPHFHYFTQYTEYEKEYWHRYQAVNERFAAVIAEEVREDDLLWVHDYQLMLVPGLIRRQFSDISIGFFLHIPFPSYEIFRTLPWRREILHGILGADLIGFHTFGYMRHFLSSTYRITGFEHSLGRLTVDGRSVAVDVFPMGIDYEKWSNPELDSDESEEVQSIREYGESRKVVLSIDRLDYSKGIPERVLAFAQFLRNNPRFRGQVTLVMVVVPSRAGVDQYQQLKEEIDELVGRVNAELSTFDWIPIRYYYRSFAFGSLSAMYRAADVALITPIRDGMNLVAKEFVASKQGDTTGVLIISEMAGAAGDLPEAITINPLDADDIESALIRALEMPPEEQRHNLQEMQKRLARYTVKHWAGTFIRQQMEIRKAQETRRSKVLAGSSRERLLHSYHSAGRPLLLLDYDGTLVGFKKHPGEAAPDEDLLATLKILHDRDNTDVVVISGRDRYTLENWLGGLGIEIVSEHGVWHWDGAEWHLNEYALNDWKPMVRPILENLVERTPGSFIEEKDYTLAWHYRSIDIELGANRVREIRDELVYLTANHNVQVLEGNKVVEIRNAGIDKGKAASRWLNRDDWDFIMAIGDDHTDEDTFRAMPEDAWTVKVGAGRSDARYTVRTVEEARGLLREMSAAAE